MEGFVMSEVDWLVAFGFGLHFGIWLWLGMAVGYLRDIRYELRKGRR